MEDSWAAGAPDAGPIDVLLFNDLEIDASTSAEQEGFNFPINALEFAPSNLAEQGHLDPPFNATGTNVSNSEGINIPGHLQANSEINYPYNNNDLTAGSTLPQYWPLDPFSTLDHSPFDLPSLNDEALQQYALHAESHPASNLLAGVFSNQAVPDPINAGWATGMDTSVYGNTVQPATNLSPDCGLDSNGHASDSGLLDTRATSITDQANAAEAHDSSEDSPPVQPAPGQHQSSASAPRGISGKHQCGTCGVRFQDRLQRSVHCHATRHHEHGCPVLDCMFAAPRYVDISRHVQTEHTELSVCNQCKRQYGTTDQLGNHASTTGHASFLCAEEDCGKTFSRMDVFRRHQDKHRSNVQRFPCPHCRRHRGADGFKRKDHLTQHLRNYHHIGVDDTTGSSARARSCPHEDCPDFRSIPKDIPSWEVKAEEHAFQKSSDYVAHMRKVHKESEFPCTEPECNRIGPKGYFRLRDLQKHKAKEHGIQVE